MKLNADGLYPSQAKAVKELRSGKNVYLKGEAGTGKTFVLNKYISECKEQNKSVLMMASTGIAALKIDGVTMHNACSIPVPAYGKYVFDIKPSQVKNLLNVDVMIIEEVSMTRNDVFEYFALVMKVVKDERKKQGIKKDTQIIVCGDFFQLPPVVKKDELSAFKRLALDPTGYCFTTPAWKEFKFKVVELVDIVRQNELEFIENLNKLRVGDSTCIDYFNQRVIQPDENVELEGKSMFICSTNAEADSINERELQKIDGPNYVYKAYKTGWCGNDYSVDEYLVLKKGARVMFMANDTNKDEYRNGQMGIVYDCLENSVMVQLETGKVIEVKRNEWTTNKITVVNGMAAKSKIGAYYQIPLRLAYATTMHKTQGQTYNSAIISPNSFADGQLYVAVSRVTDINGLYFTEEIKAEYIKVNPLVIAFANGDYEVPETRIKKKKDLATKAAQKHKEKSKKKSTKKTTAKKTTAKKTTAKKTTAKKPATKTTKTVAKKTAAKATMTKKSSSKTAASKTTKKTAVKKPVTRKTATSKKSSSSTKKSTTNKTKKRASSTKR